MRVGHQGGLADHLGAAIPSSGHRRDLLCSGKVSHRLRKEGVTQIANVLVVILEVLLDQIWQTLERHAWETCMGDMH